jgi:hypothetical protein
VETPRDDLTANRSGWLGPNQSRALLRSEYCYMGGGILALPILVAVLLVTPPRYHVFLFTAGSVSWLVAVIVQYFAITRPAIRVIRNGRVEVVEGPARWTRQGLLIGDRFFMGATRRRWSITEGRQCRAYTLPKGRIRLIALEESSLHPDEVRESS